MAKHFEGKITIVTGGGSGIGRAVAEELGRQGSMVVVTDIDESRASEVATAIRGAGGQSAREGLDVTDAEAFRGLVDRTIAEHGRLDYLFNNAGVGMTGEVRDLPEEAWDRIIDVNLRGVVHGVKAAYPRMIEQGSGHIFNMACIAGLVPFPMTAAYCATKHAVVALSTALRAEAAALGVRVSVICPGTIDTGMFDAIEYYRVDKRLIVSGIRPALMPPTNAPGRSSPACVATERSSPSPCMLALSGGSTAWRRGCSCGLRPDRLSRCGNVSGQIRPN